MNSANRKFLWSWFSIFLPIEVLILVFVSLLPGFGHTYSLSRDYLAKYPDLLRWFDLMIARETIGGYLILIFISVTISILISLIIAVGIFLRRESVFREKSKNPIERRQKQGI